jgi:hypothetical protein
MTMIMTTHLMKMAVIKQTIFYFGNEIWLTPEHITVSIWSAVYSVGHFGCKFALLQWKTRHYQLITGIGPNDHVI